MIQLQKLNKSFSGVRVLKEIDLSVEKGSVTVIIGPSGAGKSTLLRCVNLLEKPDSGTITIDGDTLDYSRYSRHEVYNIRRKTSMVFQSYNLFLHKTALANVAEGLIMVQGMKHHEAEELARYHLEKVGLGDKTDAWPAELSGGQQQRVAIARAVAMNPKVILFDEPTSALDPELVQEVLATMKKVAAEGNTMIVVTHEMSFARDVGSDIVFLDGGTILEHNNAAEFFAHPRMERTKNFLSRFFTDYNFQI